LASKPPKKPAPPAGHDPELQAACRAVWSAYAQAYEKRYKAAPVRNAPVNAKLKQFVLRVGQENAAKIAAFYVREVKEPYVAKSFHPMGLLLQNAEMYHTQWVTGNAPDPASYYADKRAEIPLPSAVWYESKAGVESKARELGLAPQGPVENFPAFTARVRRAAAPQAQGTPTLARMAVARC